MSANTRILIVVITVLFFFYLIRKVLRGKLDIKASFGWIIIDLVIFLLALIPQLTSVLSRVTGVQLPINLIFFAGFCLTLGIVFSISMDLSHMIESNRKLTQELALLKERLRKLEEERLQEDKDV